MTITQENYRDCLAQEEGQYTLWQMIAIWLAAGVPMWVLGWLVYPALSHDLPVVDAGLLRMKLMTAGLIWQFVLSMLILYWEEGNIRIGTLCRRFWLRHPVAPPTNETNKRLWWLILPLLLLIALMDMTIGPALDSFWTKVFPSLAEPAGYSLDALFAPELRGQWIGAWYLLGLFFILALFNTFLGEEFLFHGVLLPKMEGVFGRWDWVANGIGFGLYHLHQPWGVLGCILSGLVFAFTGKRFRSNWFPIILHSGQSFFFLFLILGVVLGWA